MRLHRHLCQSVTQILSDIFEQGYYADKAIEFHFRKNKSWGARDRRFIAEAVYDIVRWWRRIWFALDGESTDLWRALGAWLIIKKIDLPEWPEFQGLEREKILSRFEHCQEPAVRYSLPDWLFEYGLSQLGEEWPQTLEAMNLQADVVLRANSLKISAPELSSKLKSEGIETKTDPNFPHALILEKRANVFRTEAFERGFFEVQDASSQLVAEFLAPEPGQRVIDACAGAGGKSLHLAALMKNKGKIIAMDVDDNKLEQLRKRSNRAGADIIECRMIESSKTIKRLKDSADALLLDVPCSGSGVWRRNPDSKWKISLTEIEKVFELQREILDQYVQMLKPGGVAVYATCSVFPVENSKQVEWFLSKNPNWKLEREVIRLPHRDNYDGFYMARMVKLASLGPTS